LGFRSILKLLWVAGIIGVCLTVLPFSYIIFKPILQGLAPLVKRTARIASGLGAAMHGLWRAVESEAWPVCSWLLYYACFNLVAAAGSSSDVGDVGAYVALTGQLLAVTLTVYEVASTDGSTDRR
jgi:hypothetical protein